MYLDCKGLLAVWREGLLARKVLQGGTAGYRNHPQLIRFKANENPLMSIDIYLTHIYIESQKRCYRFDANKININPASGIMVVTDGQIAFEFEHLKSKLGKRDRLKLDEISKVKTILPNPIFTIIPGKIELWEKLSI